MAKKDASAPEARKIWCECVDEFGKMVQWEAKNNPRYKNIRMHWNEFDPKTPRK